MTNSWICKHEKSFDAEYAANSQYSSTPGSSNYGNHMTAEEVVDFFAPQQSTTDAVTEWLVSSGISPDRFALSVNKQVFLLFEVAMIFISFHSMIADFLGLSGSNSMQQPPKSKSYSLPSTTSGITSLGVMIFQAKDIIFLPISGSTLTM